MKTLTNKLWPTYLMATFTVLLATQSYVLAQNSGDNVGGIVGDSNDLYIINNNESSDNSGFMLKTHKTNGTYNNFTLWHNAANDRLEFRKYSGNSSGDSMIGSKFISFNADAGIGMSELKFWDPNGSGLDRSRLFWNVNSQTFSIYSGVSKIMMENSNSLRLEFNDKSFIMNNTGVGIGATMNGYSLNVDGKLRVSGDTRIEGGLSVEQISNPNYGSASILITDNGEVGIGALSVNHKLNVEGDLSVKQISNPNYGSASILIADNGEVGIGALNSGHKLNVEGDLRVDAKAYIYGETTLFHNLLLRKNGLHMEPGFSTDAKNQEGTLYIHSNYAGNPGAFDITDGTNTFNISEYFDNGNNGLDGLVLKGSNVVDGFEHTHEVLLTTANMNVLKAKFHSIKTSTITAKTVSVDPDLVWPDYVFASSYQLNSLDDVATFIEKNHHLPEVPSAAEIDEEGYDMAEMDAILLKKIEELTLHMIELKKENEALRTLMKQ